jgi:23S rRNA pseudouridine2605 synthase
MDEGKIRLHKYLAQCGIASRRAAEGLIRSGKVKVNNGVIVEMGCMVDGSETIEVDGQIITPEKRKVFVMLHKPTGYVTTVKDPEGRPTVMELVADIEERLYPVGRLDYDSSGLLFMTNDGDLAFRLMHPKHEVGKCYLALVEGVPSGHSLNELRRGVIIDNQKTSPAEVYCEPLNDRVSELELTIHEGRNRQVRRMCEIIGHPVIALKRIAVGKLSLGELEEGKWRYVTEEEQKTLLGE